MSIARAVVLFVLVAGLAPKSLAHERTIAGYTEVVSLTPGELRIHAKLDTGAAMSSLNALEPEFVQRQEGRWVRFRVTNREGETALFERKVIRKIKIKRAGTKIDERPVIRLGICLGGTFKVTEVNLTNRSGMNYQMLIGRNFMQSGILIDAGKQYATKPRCAAPSGRK